MTNKLLKYLIFSVLVINLTAGVSSCKKKESPTTTVNGTVLEHGSGKPVANALVKLVQRKTYTTSKVERLLDTVRAGANGAYHITVDIPTELEISEDLLVYGEAPLYFSNNETANLKGNVSRGRLQEVDVSLIPYAWVRINCFHTAGNDYVGINPPPGGTSYMKAWTDSTLITKAWGNREIEFFFFKYKDNALMEQVSQMVYPLAHDTIDIEIHF